MIALTLVIHTATWMQLAALCMKADQLETHGNRGFMSDHAGSSIFFANLGVSVTQLVLSCGVLATWASLTLPTIVS